MNETAHLHSRSGARAGWWHYADALQAGKPFDTPTGNLRGERHTPGQHVRRGELPEAHAATLDRADYVVWSWQTPIAWHDPMDITSRAARGRWHVPAVHYSQTTTIHQGKILTAVQEVTRMWGDAPVVR